MSIYKGYTYEVDATAHLNIVVGSGSLDFVEVAWSGDWDARPYVTKVGETKTDLNLRLSKSLEVADSYSTIETNVKANAQDSYWSPQVFEAEDSGKVGWEISEQILPHNNPDICIQETATVQEGDVGQITTGTIQVCLSEEAKGEPLTVSYRTREGTAKGGIGVQNLAYDEYGNPFISVTQSASDNIRVVYDGGFPKYYNSSMNQNSKQFLKNCVTFCHQVKARPKKILALGDSHPNYGMCETDGSGFRTSFTTVANELGYEIEFSYINDFHGGSPAPADFAGYAMMFYMGTATQISETAAASVYSAAQSGLGIVLITDHDVFQGSVNRIAKHFNAEFFGVVDRHPVSIADLKSKYGDHVLWSNMSGDLHAGGSEGNIRNKAQGEFLGMDGVLTFALGEKCKNIEYQVFGNRDITGNKYFYMDLANASHGNITCPTGTIVIEDDDVLPCGAAAGAGGDGVAYYKLTTGSKPTVVAALWMAYGKHDRFDMYKNGNWIGGSQQDLDLHFGDAHPTYDRAAYNQATGGQDGTAIMELRQHNHNRAGGGAIFGSFYPLMTDDPFYADLRCEGPNGTGWHFGTMCFPAKDISASSNLVIDNSIIQRMDHIEIFDCEENLGAQEGRFRFLFENLDGDPFGTENKTTFQQYDLNNSIGFRCIPCRLTFFRNRQQVHQTGWIAPNTSATVEIDHKVGEDFRYLEMWVTYDFTQLEASYLIQTDYEGSNQSKPPRVAWRMTINRV